MSTYRIKLLRKEEVAAGTIAFHWEKPEGFKYVAGQTGDWAIVSPVANDKEGVTRTFTIASAPYEEDLIFTTRIRDSAFKQDMKLMESGGEISIQGPSGDFVLHDDASVQAVFLTGGIGATPARSILLQAAHDKRTHKITLFYSNRRPEDAAYLDLFEKLTKELPNFQFVPTMTLMEKSSKPWSGETGEITLEKIKKYIPDIKAPIYYIDGPPEMVKAMKKIVADAGVDEKQIKSEDFEGY